MWIFLFVLTTLLSKHSWPLPHIYELTNSLFHAKHLVGLELVLDAFLPPYFYQIMRNCSYLGSSIQLTATTGPNTYFSNYIANCHVVEGWCDLKKWLGMGGVWWISSRSRRLWGLKNWLTQMKYLWSQCKLTCGICIVCISCIICKEFLNNWADSGKPVWCITPSSWVFGNLFGTLSSFWRSKQLVISCFPWRTSPLTDNSDNVTVSSPQTLVPGQLLWSRGWVGRVGPWRSSELFVLCEHFIERDMRHGPGCAFARFDCTHVSDDQDCGHGWWRKSWGERRWGGCDYWPGSVGLETGRLHSNSDCDGDLNL